MNDRVLIDAEYPRVGQIFEFFDDSPWPVEGGRVRILDIAHGWVRYTRESVPTDERRPLALFLSMYRRVA